MILFFWQSAEMGKFEALFHSTSKLMRLEGARISVANNIIPVLTLNGKVCLYSNRIYNLLSTNLGEKQQRSCVELNIALGLIRRNGMAMACSRLHFEASSFRSVTIATKMNSRSSY